MKHIFYIFIHIWLAIGIKTVLTEFCGNVSQSTEVAEGESVKVTFLPERGWTAKIWYFSSHGKESNTEICRNSESSCISQKYHLLGNTLTIENFTRGDVGHYTVFCSTSIWSHPAVLSIKLAAKGTRKKQQNIPPKSTDEYPSTTLMTARPGNETGNTVDTAAKGTRNKQQNIPPKSTDEYPSTTLVTARPGNETVKTENTAAKGTTNKQQNIPPKSTDEYPSTTLVTSRPGNETGKTEDTADTSTSKEQQVHPKHRSMMRGVTASAETVKPKVSDSATDYKVSSSLKDTSQFTTIVVAVVVAVGLMLTVIAIAIICKKYKKNSSHQASQKSGQKQIFEGADGQDNSLPNDSGRSHSRQPSERQTSALQYEAEHNLGALYDQQASGSVAEQINSEYATVVPTQDRISGTQQRDINKVVIKEEEGSPEYATVVKCREPGCRVEQSVQGGKDKNEHGLVYADLDLVSRPLREADSKEHEATEYVSIDFQKTATLKSQQKK